MQVLRLEKERSERMRADSQAQTGSVKGPGFGVFAGSKGAFGARGLHGNSRSAP